MAAAPVGGAGHSPLTIAFYTPGNDSALASLHAHMGQTTGWCPA
jgi:hypothetical protein